MSGVKILTLPDGSSVRSHIVPVAEEAMGASLSANMVPGATHVVTIHGGVSVRAGDPIIIDSQTIRVMAVYDPYEKPGVTQALSRDFSTIKDANQRALAQEDAARQAAVAKQSLAAQKGRWLKLLIRQDAA